MTQIIPNPATQAQPGQMVYHPLSAGGENAGRMVYAPINPLPPRLARQFPAPDTATGSDQPASA